MVWRAILIGIYVFRFLWSAERGTVANCIGEGLDIIARRRSIVFRCVRYSWPERALVSEHFYCFA